MTNLHDIYDDLKISGLIYENITESINIFSISNHVLKLIQLPH